MNRFRPPALVLLVLLGAGVAAAELGWWWQARGRAQRALIRLEQARLERDELARLSPAPSAENEARLAREIATQRARLARLREGLQSPAPSPLTEPAPERPAEAFFALAAWVEKARTRASADRVALRPDERFGFSRYAHEGPPAALVAVVHRQQQAVQILLNPLFEARPLALLGVRRASPASEATGGEDFFALEPGLSVRHAGLVETEPLRFEFTGQTSTLRNFLNGLAEVNHPVTVRSLVVEPLPATENARVAADTATTVPVVGQSLSKFTVTVEFVCLPEAPSQPAS